VAARGAAPAGNRVGPEHTVAFGPGRVNLIGEHTDYNDGLALPFAIDAGVLVSATATGDQSIRAHAIDLGSSDTYMLGGEAPSPGGWRAFVRGATAELAAAGLPLRGATLEIEGTIARGAGLSSSAALEVALCLALLALADSDVVPPWPLARICSRVENEWVGANTGLLDQLASLCGRENTAMRIDFRSGVIEPVPLGLGDWRLVTLDSGVVHSHAESGYNDRRRECAQACEALGIASLRELQPEMLERLPAPLDARARHVFEENARVDATVAALSRGDLAAVGALLDASHASLRDLYEISTPELEAAVARLRDGGAAGARLMGGGFGGSVLGLLPPDAVAPAEAIEVRPGPGARVLER
jgi:galactokinase